MASVFTRYLEGGNRHSALVIPSICVLTLWRYDYIAEVISRFQVDQQLVYSYSFNALAVAIGALLSLFTFIASRPTQFLQRIQKTSLFWLLLSNLQATTIICSVSLLLTFLIGVTNLVPARQIDLNSVLVVAWFGQLSITFCFLFRSVRSAFITLTSDF